MASVAFVGDREGHGGIERVGRAVVELLGDHRVDDFRAGTRRASWAAQLPGDRRRLARLRPQVVFADRIYFAPYALLASAFIRPAPRRVLWLHGSELASPRQRRQKAVFLRRFDTLICSSRFTRQLVEENFRDQRITSRLTVINPGVDAEYWQALCEGEQKSGTPDFEVLTVGRLTANSAHKGVERVAEAVGRLRQSGQTVRLTIVGDGPLAAEVDAFAERVTDGAYRRLESASDRVLAHQYARANVMALPSVPTQSADRTFVEGFGLVFLEAAACGTPSIGGEHSGAADAISVGRSGELVDGSVESIVAALERMLKGARPSAESCMAWAYANRWVTRRDAIERAFFGEPRNAA